MRQLLFWIALIISIKSYAQNEAGQRKWSLGIFYSSDYTYRILTTNSNNPTYEGIVKNRNESEKPMYGFYTGIHTSFYISPKIEIALGVAYSLRGEKEVIEMEDLQFGDMVPPRNGQVYDTSHIEFPKKFSFNYRYTFIEFPVSLNFHPWQRKKINVYFTAGISPAFFIQAANVNYLYYENKEREKTKTIDTFDGYNKWNGNARAGVGIAYNVNEKINVRCQPYFQYYVRPLADSPLISHLYAAGCNILVSYTF